MKEILIFSLFTILLLSSVSMVLPNAYGITVTGAPVDIRQDNLRVGDRPFVTVTDTYSNFDPVRIDSIQVVVKGYVTKSVACNTIGTFTLSETGPNTREFSGSLLALTYEDMWCYRGDQPNKWIEVSYKIGSTHNSDYAFLIMKEPRINDPCGPDYELRSDGLCYEIVYPNVNNGGACLIATATYGSEIETQVQQLRELRDNSLLQTESGTLFMESFNDFYYSFSPIIADYERENPVFREMVKIAITPMISSLSLLNYVDMDSEDEVLGYGISLILLNVGMYFGIPIIAFVGIRKRF